MKHLSAPKAKNWQACNTTFQKFNIYPTSYGYYDHSFFIFNRICILAHDKTTIMKTKFVYAALLLAGCSVIGLASSCGPDCISGSGTRKTETRTMEKFTKINIAGNFAVHLVQDSSLKVGITASDNLFDDIKTTVSGGRLEISLKKSVCNNGAMSLDIGVQNLEDITTAGNEEVDNTGTLNVKDIGIHASGAAKFTLNMNAANVTTDGSGVIEMNLKGQASSHTVSTSGICKMNALDFVVGDYDIETSGISKCQVNVLHSLTINSSGASDTKYRGNPSNVTNHKSGAATLERVN